MHRADGDLGGMADEDPRPPFRGDPVAGYRLWFNRDELRSRGPEVPPRVEQTPEGMRYIAPSDSDAGGTWIAVNELGITVCLLNGYRAPQSPETESTKSESTRSDSTESEPLDTAAKDSAAEDSAAEDSAAEDSALEDSALEDSAAENSEAQGRARWTSRGHLVRELAGVRSHAEVWRQMAPGQLARYRPLVLAVLVPDRPALIVRWDGRDAVLDPRGELQLPVISSSHEQSEVDRRRRQRFHDMVRTDPSSGQPIHAAELEAFQSWAPEAGADAYSPSMSRPDAGTRSQCMVVVSPEEVRLRYTAGPPHSTQPGPSVRLPRRMKPRSRR